MKIVIIGGRGLIGSKVATKLSVQGHDVIAASRRSGVDSLTGEGLAKAVAGADVLVDVADSPLFDDEPVMHFFTTTTTNLLAAEQEAGVKHHVALSVVGAQIMPDSGYNTAKAAQENLIKDSGRPYSIVRATPFYEFAVGLADSATRRRHCQVATRVVPSYRRRRCRHRRGPRGCRAPDQRSNGDRWTRSNGDGRLCSHGPCRHW